MVNNPELINKMINNINKLDDELIKEAIKGVESEDMEEDIKTIENIIDTLKFHIEYENYEENILDECKRDIKALENLLKENNQLKTDKSLQIQMNKRLIEEGIPISVIQNKKKYWEQEHHIAGEHLVVQVLDEILEKGNK